jgi:hypothetical protein
MTNLRSIGATLLLFMALAWPAQAQTRLAVFVVTFPTSDPAPPQTMDWTRDLAAQVDAFHVEQSYGQYALTSDVFGIYTVPLDLNATHADIAAAAQQAAVAAGVDLSPYAGCGASLCALYLSPQTTVVTVPYGDNTGAWIPGTTYPRVPSYQTALHELGHHLFGATHDHGYRCVDAKGQHVPMDFAKGSSCTYWEYGDDLSVMGQGFGHWSAVSKPWLTAVGPWQIQSVPVDGDYPLAPFETATPGVKALRVTGSDWTYVVEYRQPIGFDVPQQGSLPANIFSGVIVHLSLAGSRLLFMNPPDPATGKRRPALTVGQTFCDGPGRVSLLLVSATPDGAVVRVNFGHCK